MNLQLQGMAVMAINNLTIVRKFTKKKINNIN